MHLVVCMLGAAGPITAVATDTAPLPTAVVPGDEFADIDLFVMEVPVVVSGATRRRQPLKSLPYAASVITAEDIRRSGARSIPDALRLVPGIDVADLSYANSVVGPRGLYGFAGRETLVLVDGRQIYDAMTGATIWGMWPFQLEDIERIEVIRGPGGVTWGANAVSGFINIVTKDPFDQLGLTVTGGGGSQGSHKTHLGYGWADDKLRLRVSGEYEASDGFQKGGSFLSPLEDDHKIGRMAAHAIYDLGLRDTLTFSAGSALADGGWPPTPSAGFGVGRNPSSRSEFILTHWDHQIAPDNNLRLTGYVNDAHLCLGVRPLDYQYQQGALQLSHTFTPATDHTLTWGIDTRMDWIDGSPASPSLMAKDHVTTGIVGLYVQDEWRFAPRWALNVGGRIDYEAYGGFQPSARTSLSYDVTDHSFIYGAISRAFQITPAGSRFFHMPMLNGLAYGTANQDVPAETVIAYELGHRGTFFDALETSVSVFWHEFDDLGTLSARPGPPGLIRYHLDGGYSASVYGAELEARYKVNDQLTLLGHYTFQRFVRNGSTLIDDTDIPIPPKHKFMLGARYSPLADLHLSSHLYYVDAAEARNPANPIFRRHIAPYFRLDLRAEYEFWKDQASVAVGVRNLLDPNHYEGGTTFLNDAQVPRMVYAEFRFSVR